MDLSSLVANSTATEPSMMPEPVKETGGYMASIIPLPKPYSHNPSVLVEPFSLLLLEHSVQALLLSQHEVLETAKPTHRVPRVYRH